tara:strand:+ start:3113 stop:4039 length:927 start_codon:yes stop_codon:yes gene_type:complete
LNYLENIKFPVNIDVFANQIVEGFITGMHKSPYHGFSVEFSEHRLYNKGESTKNIDWKLYGRTDKLFVKRYEEETNLRCQLIIDSSSSMYYPNFNKPNFHQPNKLFFSAYASAVLMNLLKRQRDAIGLSIVSDNLEFHTPSRTTRRHHQLLYHQLEELLKIDAVKDIKKTHSTHAIHEISEILHRRSMVMIFTDMISNTEDLEKQFEAFKHLKYNKHEVVLFYLNEPITEMNLDFDGNSYNFIDVETGEELRLNPENYKKEYQQKMEKYMKELRLKCLQYKIDLVEVDINEGFDKILTGYLLKRQKMF